MEREKIWDYTNITNPVAREYLAIGKCPVCGREGRGGAFPKPISVIHKEESQYVTYEHGGGWVGRATDKCVMPVLLTNLLARRKR